MLVDMRSVDAGELEKLSAKLHQAIEEAVNEENARWGYGTLSSESTGTLDDNNMTAKSSVGDTAGAVPVNADNGDREIPQQKMTALQSPFEQKGRRSGWYPENPARLSRLQMLQNQAIGMETSVHRCRQHRRQHPHQSWNPAITKWAGRKRQWRYTSTNGTTNLPESWKGPQRDLLCCWRYRAVKICRYQLPCINPKGK